MNWPQTGALLLVGSALQGSARAHAKSILCKNDVHGETLFETGAHPDFYWIAPEENSQWIKIQQVRDFIEWSLGKPQIAQNKVAVIMDAHCLNLQAANALLKTVEEPNPTTLIVLVTERPALLPATLRSRCFKVRVEQEELLAGASSLTEASSFPRMRESSPLFTAIKTDLQALQSNQLDFVSIAAKWAKQDSKQVIQALWAVCFEKANSKAESQALRKNQTWWSFVEAVCEARRSLDSPMQPNVQLLFESLLVDFPRI